MATVTETYILEQKEGATNYPSSANTRWQAAQANGVIVSVSKEPIIDPSQIVAGKTRNLVTIVWRSEEDRQQYANEALADSAYQSYVITSETKRINRTTS
jgi:hypothetical protein